MTLAAFGFFKFLFYFVLMIICAGVGTAIAMSMMSYCEQHFDKIWLEIIVTLVPTISWCLFSVWLIVLVICKLSNINLG